MADFGFKILVNTDDAFLDLGPFIHDEPLNDDKIKSIIKLALNVNDWDYTKERVFDVVLVCIDCDTLDTVIFDLDIDDVWPDCGSEDTDNFYAPKGGDKKKHG